MSEMIERVAAALAKQDEYDDWSGLTARYQRHYRDAARAAIEAMREPSDAMLASENVQTNCPMCGGHLEGWHTMMDVALKE